MMKANRVEQTYAVVRLSTAARAARVVVFTIMMSCWVCER